LVITDDLANSWIPLTNIVTGTGGNVQPVDAGGASQPQRFYRAVQLP